MADIRSFFGGGTKKDAPRAASSAINATPLESSAGPKAGSTSGSKKRPKSTSTEMELVPQRIPDNDDVDFLDSDEDHEAKSKPKRLRLHGAKDREREKVEEREKLAKVTASPARSSRSNSNSDSATKATVIKITSSDTAELPSTGKGKRGSQSRNVRSESAGVVLDLAMTSEREDGDSDFEVDVVSEKEFSGRRAKKLSKVQPLASLDTRKAAAAASTVPKMEVASASSFFKVPPSSSSSSAPLPLSPSTLSPPLEEEKVEVRASTRKSPGRVLPPSSSSVTATSPTPSATAPSSAPPSSSRAKRVLPMGIVTKEDEEKEGGEGLSSASKTDKNTNTKVPARAAPAGSNSKWTPKLERSGPALGAMHSSELPQGAKNCLEGLKFVITGVLDRLGREQVEDLVMTYGGKVASAVSGKTDYLIAGTLLDDGRPVADSNKYKNAVEKKVTILTEDLFLEKIRSSNPSGVAPNCESNSKSSAEAPATSAGDKSSCGGGVGARKTPYPPVTSNSTKSSYATSSSSSSSSSSAWTKKAPTVGTGLGESATVQNGGSIEDRLWVDKYKPSRFDQVIGNGDVAKKLVEWLRRWDQVHLKKSVKVPFAKENPGAKAVLLSGPPGIGKTTIATLAAAELGFEALELNASDARSKRAISEQVADVVLCQSMSADGTTKKRLVIMDEVDGMGGSDRGGIPELIKVIKSSRSPIICICNDRQAQKIRSLVNHCYDLRVKRPTKMQIASRMISIAKEEGLQVEQNAAEILVEQVGSDIRQVLHAMQMWRAKSRSMRYGEMKDGMQRIEKDKVLRQSPFDACLQILSGSKSNFDERYNAFFIDYSLIPLMVQQNYVDSSKSGIFKMPQLSDGDRMDALSRASDAASDMDLAGASLRGANQHWELLPTQAAFSLRVGSIISGFQAFPAFPQWLGKNSTAGKFKRLTQELVLHSSLAVGQGFSAIRMEYVPYLRSIMLRPLLTQGSDGVQEVIALLDSYGLSREDLMETLKEMQFTHAKDPLLKDAFENIESSVKAAFTRSYNSTAHTSQALVSSQAAGKKKRGGGGGGDEEETGTVEDLEASRADDEDEEEKEDQAASKFMKKAKAKSSSSASAAKTKKPSVSKSKSAAKK